MFNTCLQTGYFSLSFIPCQPPMNAFTFYLLFVLFFKEIIEKVKWQRQAICECFAKVIFHTVNFNFNDKPKSNKVFIFAS